MIEGADSKGTFVLSQAYASGLREYVSGAGETALKRAYDLGRKAASDGVGVLQMAVVHHQALAEMFGHEPVTVKERVGMAAQFFAEAISTFEMTLRSHQANARLLGLSEVLARQNAESDRAHEQLRTILDATTAIIYLKDVEGRYLFINRQFQNAFGLRREQVIGKSDEDILPKPIADVLREDDHRALCERTPQELEEILQVKGGSRTYLSLKFPLVDAAGASYAICCVSTDITERKKTDEALRRAKDAADTANQELEAFSYSVAHDLRAPLRSISGFSHALLEDCADQLDVEGKMHLQHVIDSAHYMGRLIEDLLALSHVSRGDLRKERVNLSELVHHIAARLQASDPARLVDFVIQEGIFEQGDVRLLEVALDNLIGNAWKFTGRRAGARIEFGVESDKKISVYFVRDNGAGFDMAHAGKLFGVFQRLHSIEEFEGTGIGLVTVQRIVRRHGGRVWAKGALDEGATFYFSLQEEGF